MGGNTVDMSEGVALGLGVWDSGLQGLGLRGFVVQGF